MKKKDRRHSGRKTDKVYKPQEFPYELTYWDDWSDYRDGMRNQRDRTKNRKSLKNKKMLKRREAMKDKG